MTKRKRPEAGHVEDVGLGETLARIREEARAEDALFAAAKGDDEGWTTVESRGNKRARQSQAKSPATGPKKYGDNGSEVRNSPGQAQTEQHANSAEQPNVSEPHAPSSLPKQFKEDSEAKKPKPSKNYPAIEHSHHARLQNHVKISDLQSLVLYLLADGFAPQWVSVRNRMGIRKVVVLMVPGLESDMFNGRLPLEAAVVPAPTTKDDQETASTPPPATDQPARKPKRTNISPDDYYPVSLKPDRLPEVLAPLSDMFPHIWPIKGSGEHRSNQYFRIHSPIQTMLTSQVPKSREERELKKNTKGPVHQNSKHWQNKRTPITEYIATLVEQQENEFVVHPAWYTTPEAKDAAYQRRKAAKQTTDNGWVDTNVTSIEDGEVPDKEIDQGSVTAGRTIFTIDCEMCKSDEDKFVLTRVSLLDWAGSVVLDKLVKPDVPIKDYLTQYSGITADMLKDVTTTLRDVQKELLELFTPRTILLGHSLNSDLNALQLTHPFLVDTGILYPHVRGPPYKQSLKYLATKFLGKEIQKGGKGHDSVEDALAALDLVKQKCERGPRWGTGDTNSESIFKRLSRVSRPGSSNAFRGGAVVDWGEPNRGHGGQAQVALGCGTDEEVIDGIKLALCGQAIGKQGITEEVDFLWARLRELELVRGWWDNTKTDDVEAIRQAALERLGRPVPSDDQEDTDAEGAELGDAVARTVSHIGQVYESLPPCTAFIVYSGTSDPREIRRLQAMRAQHQREYQTKNWDNLSVKWTDTEVQALSRACQSARDGIGFVTVK